MHQFPRNGIANAENVAGWHFLAEIILFNPDFEQQADDSTDSVQVLI